MPKPKPKPKPMPTPKRDATTVVSRDEKVKG
jgi:hypothetical protein